MTLVSQQISGKRTGTTLVKRGFAQMQKGGVVVDVTTVEQAQIAEAAGAVAVMVLDKLPADIRAAGGVARMADAKRIQAVTDKITIPVMAKCRIGHYGEARILQELGVDMIDESEVLTPADENHHIDKWGFTVPFVNGCRDLGEAMRRISEGASMLRTKGEPGTGNVAEAVRHLKLVLGKLRELKGASAEQIRDAAREFKVQTELVEEAARTQRLPIVNFAAGGIATPADAALMMELGADGIFVGSGIFKSKDPQIRAEAVVLAASRWNDPSAVLEASKMISEESSMFGLDIRMLKPEQLMQVRGV